MANAIITFVKMEKKDRFEITFLGTGVGGALFLERSIPTCGENQKY